MIRVGWFATKAVTASLVKTGRNFPVSWFFSYHFWNNTPFINNEWMIVIILIYHFCNYTWHLPSHFYQHWMNYTRHQPEQFKQGWTGDEARCWGGAGDLSDSWQTGGCSWQSAEQVRNFFNNVFQNNGFVKNLGMLCTFIFHK